VQGMPYNEDQVDTVVMGPISGGSSNV